MVGLVLLIITISLSIGPLGRLALTEPLTPNLFIVFLWALAWFRGRPQSLRLALIGGVALDLVGFSYFGIWTAISLAVVLGIELMKTRLLHAGSLFHALLSLALVSLLAKVVIAVMAESLSWQILLGVAANVLLGVMLYYLLAMRFRLIERWAGRRVG